MAIISITSDYTVNITEVLILSKKYGYYRVILDLEDYGKILKYSWHIKKGGNTFYAATNIKISENKRKTLLMHTLITGYKIVDHKNGNGCDNRKNNLREVNKGENNRNAKTRKDKTTSKYKGVVFMKDREKWRARINSENNKRIVVGQFNSEIEAAKAYNEAAKKYYGNFAKLNIIEETT